MASSSITSSDHRLPMSKRRLNPLSLRDYLLDDLSSCSSNGFKSFPRRQSTLRRLLDSEIKRSRVFHRKRRYNCGLAFSHAVQKASTVLLSAVKFLPLPSSSVISLSHSGIKGIFSRSFSGNIWKNLSHRELDNIDDDDDGEIERKIQLGRSLTFGEFLLESLDQSSNVSFSGEEELSNAAGDVSELFTNLEVTQSSGESTDAVGDETEETRNSVVVMMSGDCAGSRVSDRSSVNDNREECVNEEKEQLSPISILECPFQDVAMTPDSHQKGKFTDYLLEYLYQYTSTEEPNHLLVSQKVDKLLLDFFKEDRNIETRDEDTLVKIAEEWVMRRPDEEHMFMSWEVEEKREIYDKEMKWGYINDQAHVVEELGMVLLLP